MGNKGTKTPQRVKQHADERYQPSVEEILNRKRRQSKEELAVCLASLNNMASTGINMADYARRRISRDELEKFEGENGRAGGQKPSGQMSDKMSAEGQKNENCQDDAHNQLDLLDNLEGQEDTNDWASMREWLVWCMNDNLDDRGRYHTTDVPSRTTCDGSSRKQSMIHQHSLDSTLSNSSGT